MFTKAEKLISIRNLRPKKKEGFLKVISIFSFLGIMLGVAILIIVMSVMNGFKTDLTNKILGLMNRKHTIEEYLKIHAKLKEINENIEFSSDFIIGYPGEDEEAFQNTIELIERINFINSYSFIFSPRPGTVAANLKLIEKKISMTRLEKVQTQLFDNQKKMNKSLENKVLNVLVENLSENKTDVFGRSEHMTSVIFSGTKSDIGKIIPVKIKGSNRSTLFGEKINISNQGAA